MGDTLKKVQSGDPLEIPARTFNTFVDAAQDFLARQRGTGQQITRAYRDPDIVLVKNSSGADRSQLHILGIDSPVIDPGENADEFKNKPAVAGVTPSSSLHFGRFVVLLEPLAAGEIGRACVSGLVPAKVNVRDDGHEYADVRGGDCSKLDSTDRGGAYILWRESGTGEKWALVKLSIPAAEPEVGPFVVKVEMDGGYAGNESEDCSYTYTVKSLSGDVLGTQKTPEAARYPRTEYWYGGEDAAHSDYGLACYDNESSDSVSDSDDGLILLVAYGEKAKVTDCQESAS